MPTLRLEINNLDPAFNREEEFLYIQSVVAEAMTLLNSNAGRQYHTLTDGDGNNIGSIFYQISDFREAGNEKT